MFNQMPYILVILLLSASPCLVALILRNSRSLSLHAIYGHSFSFFPFDYDGESHVIKACFYQGFSVYCILVNFYSVSRAFLENNIIFFPIFLLFFAFWTII